MAKIKVDLDRGRSDLRHMFYQWGLDPSEVEIIWQEETVVGLGTRRLPGCTVRYLRKGKWQTVSSFTGPTRAANLRMVYLFLDRIRIAEKSGVQYQDLSWTKAVATTSGPNGSTGERDRKEALLEAYDVVGCAPDDSIETIKAVYLAKSKRYHPDMTGGDADAQRFKKLKDAYELVMKSRGQQP